MTKINNFKRTTGAAVAKTVTNTSLDMKDYLYFLTHLILINSNKLQLQQ